jgi:hypothetical protein
VYDAETGEGLGPAFDVEGDPHESGRLHPTAERDASDPERGQRDQGGARVGRRRHIDSDGPRRGAGQPEEQITDPQDDEQQEGEPHPERRRPGQPAGPGRRQQTLADRLDHEGPPEQGDAAHEQAAPGLTHSGIDHESLHQVRVCGGQEGSRQQDE